MPWRSRQRFPDRRTRRECAPQGRARHLPSRCKRWRSAVYYQRTTVVGANPHQPLSGWSASATIPPTTCRRRCACACRELTVRLASRAGAGSGGGAGGNFPGSDWYQTTYFLMTGRRYDGRRQKVRLVLRPVLTMPRCSFSLRIRDFRLIEKLDLNFRWRAARIGRSHRRDRCRQVHPDRALGLWRLGPRARVWHGAAAARPGIVRLLSS